MHASISLAMQAPCNGPDQATEARLLEMVRSGAHPLDVYNTASDIPKASAVLAKVLQTCFLYFSSYRTINTAKSVMLAPLQLMSHPGPPAASLPPIPAAQSTAGH